MINDFKLSNNTHLPSKNKLIRTRRPSQEFDLINPQLNVEVLKDPYKFFSSLNRRQRRILNCLLYWSATTGKIYVRQDSLANYAGYKSRCHVNELLGWFIELGIIASYYRHKTSCLYKVSSFFNDCKIRAQLKSLFSALGYFSIAALNGPIEQKPTQYVSNYLFINIESKSKSNQLNQREYKHVRVSECARTRENSNEAKTKTERVMIKQYVEEIKDIYLTEQDKIQLSKYSEAAIAHGRKKLAEKKDANNPIAYLIACCKSFKEGASSFVRSNFDSKRERSSIERVEPVYRVSSKEERDLRTKKRLIYFAQMRGEGDDYLKWIENNTAPILEIENMEWERTKFHGNRKAEKEGKPLTQVLGTVGPIMNDEWVESNIKPNRDMVTELPKPEYTHSTSVMGQRSIGELIREHFKID